MPMTTDSVMFEVFTDVGKAIADMNKFDSVNNKVTKSMHNAIKNTDKFSSRSNLLGKSLTLLNAIKSKIKPIVIAVKHRIDTIKNIKNKDNLGSNKDTDILAGKTSRASILLSKVFNKLKSSTESIGDKFKNVFDTIKDSADDLVGSVTSLIKKIPIIGLISLPFLAAAGYVEKLAREMRDAAMESERFGNVYSLATKSIAIATKNNISTDSAQQLLKYATSWGILQGSLKEFTKTASYAINVLGLTGDAAGDLVEDFGQIAGFDYKSMRDLITDMKHLAVNTAMTNEELVNTVKSMRTMFIQMPYLSLEARKKMTKDFMYISASMSEAWQDPQDLLSKYQAFAKDIYSDENRRLGMAFSQVGVDASSARKDMNLFYEGLNKFADMIERQYGANYFLERSQDISRIWGISGEELVKYTTTTRKNVDAASKDALRSMTALEKAQKRATIPVRTLSEQWQLALAKLKLPFATIGIGVMKPLMKLSKIFIDYLNNNSDKIVKIAEDIISHIPSIIANAGKALRGAINFVKSQLPLLKASILPIFNTISDFINDKSKMESLASTIKTIATSIASTVATIAGFLSKHPRLLEFAVGGYVANKATGGMLSSVAGGLAGAALGSGIPALGGLAGKGIQSVIASPVGKILPGIAVSGAATIAGSELFGKTPDEKDRMRAGGAVGGTIGSIVGAIFGGPAGSALGGLIGSAAGQAVGKFLPEIKTFFTNFFNLLKSSLFQIVKLLSMPVRGIVEVLTKLPLGIGDKIEKSGFYSVAQSAFKFIDKQSEFELLQTKPELTLPTEKATPILKTTNSKGTTAKELLMSTIQKPVVNVAAPAVSTHVALDPVVNVLQDVLKEIKIQNTIMNSRSKNNLDVSTSRYGN